MLRRFAAILLALLICALPLLAQTVEDGTVTDITQRLERVRNELAGVSSEMAQSSIPRERFAELQTRLTTLSDHVAEQGKRIAPPLTDIGAQLLKLGPAPEAGKTEARAVAAQRRKLNDLNANYVDLQKQIDVLQLELSQVDTKLSAKERDFFFQRIFSGDRSIANPGLWGDLIGGTGIVLGGAATLTKQWWEQGTRGAQLSTMLLIPVLIALAVLAFRMLRRRFASSVVVEGADQHTSLDRLFRVFWGVLAVIAGIALFFLVLAIGAAAISPLTTSFNAVLRALFTIAMAVGLNSSLAWFICAPSRPDMRLIAIDDSAARTLPLLVSIASFAASLNPALDVMAQVMSVPRSYAASLSAVAALILIASLAASLTVIRRQARAGLAGSGTYYLAWFVNLIPLVWLLLGVAALGLLLGYLSFSYFISNNVLETALLLMVVVLAHHLADALSEAAIQPERRVAKFFAERLGFEGKTISRMALLFRTGVDVLLVVLAVPALLTIWTVSLVDFDTLYRGFSSGFTFGSITLSPWSILLGIAVLAIGVTLTRIFAGWLNQRVLSETRLDKGVQDSVRTAARYTGYIIAGALALSVAGLDFSNIAIIAGALGVGIGFGLQSIVNNFVSGLILLAERPVRVGDWVVTNAGEGVVKKINVRSTEIETFDNCTVIVPNSNLITESVRNWTHHDTMGRFNIAVTIDPATTDIDSIVESLKEIGTSHSNVLRYPEPQVQLSSMTPQGLVFELKGHVADVFAAPKITSELRLSIVRKLAELKVRLSSTTNYARPVR